MEHQGWIKLHRQILDWQWYKDVPCRVLFEHILLTANHSPARWQLYDVERGQKITSVDNLSSETGLTTAQVRHALKKLNLTNDLAIKTTNKFSIITVTNYNSYQEDSKQNSKQVANESQTDSKQIATNKNNKNNKNEENEKNKDGEVFILPDWIPKQDWEDWLEVRKKKGAVETIRAKQLAVKTLEDLKQKGQSPKAVIEQSILRSWIGLFEVKPSQNNYAKAPQPTNPRPNLAKQKELIYG